MRSEFPLNHKRTQLGIIPEPVIPLLVLTKFGFKKIAFGNNFKQFSVVMRYTFLYHQKFDFLVDTGADCSIMPKSVAADLGPTLSGLPKISFIGVEGRGVTAYLAKITIKITNAPVEITCALSENEKTPFILGRKDIFDRFNIAFDNKKRIIIFSPLP